MAVLVTAIHVAQRARWSTWMRGNGAAPPRSAGGREERLGPRM